MACLLNMWNINLQDIVLCQVKPFIITILKYCSKNFDWSNQICLKLSSNCSNFKCICTDLIKPFSIRISILSLNYRSSSIIYAVDNLFWSNENGL